MRVRSFIAATTALVLVGAGGLVSNAHAADPVVDADVGGAAEGIQAVVRVQSFSLLPPLLQGADTAELTIVKPKVVLGRNGGNLVASVVNQTVGPVNVRALRTTIKGNRQGTPFAEATTSLTGVTIAGTDIHAIQTFCRWDAAHAIPTATTTIVGAGGTVYTPAPNSPTEIPGLGTLVLNEQFIDHAVPVYDSTGAFRYAEVIYVYGAHLYLTAEAADLYNTVDIILGFASCDPLNLGVLGGLKLLQTNT